jgi:penicillin-binding protein 1A
MASKVYAADGRIITDFGLERRTMISLDSMAPALPAAFLAVEDKRFYSHNGVDMIGFVRALKTNILALSVEEGFSTITMQLAGNRFPEEINRRERGGISGLTRKMREARFAMEIEDNYPKDKILEMYLNQIYLGNGANGVETAALRYFGKSASQVNVAEAALLAALPQAPTRYNPRLNPRAAVERRNLVLELMRQSGALTPDEAETWKAYPMALSSRSDYSGRGEYFVEYVRQLVDAQFGGDLYRAGYRIYTTLDIDAQAAAERALAAQLTKVEEEPGFRHTTYREYMEKKGGTPSELSNSPYIQGAVVVLEARTGNILAMVGGRDFEDSKYNRAVQALRQPGSTFKPLVYAAAVEHGIPMSRVEMDEPVSVRMPDGQPNWEPANYSGRFDQGAISLRTALLLSVNSVAVKVGLEVGLPPIVEMARRFGIRTRINTVPALILGALEVHPIDMVAAYSTFANLGTRVEPNAIIRVEDRFGQMLWEPKPVSRNVLDRGTAWMLTDVLQGVVTGGTARNAVWNAGFRIPSGGKTGTTNDYNDVWYIGFTNDLVAGVWMGFDHNREIMRNAQGGRLAAPAWTMMMQEIYQRRRAPGGWAQPENLSRPVEIDKTTGYRATPFCPDDVRETRFYPPGAEPREYCPIHSPYRVGDTH